LSQRLPTAGESAGRDRKVAHTGWRWVPPAAGRFVQNRQSDVYRTEKPAKSAYLPCPDV